MIGSGLKKMALANEMTVSNGVAYGNFKGYAATFSEGQGYKKIVFTVKFPEPAKMDALQQALNQKNISREYRVQNLTIAPNGIHIVFTDNPGTLKKMQAFLDWLLPLLAQAAATGFNVCPECGDIITDGRWVLLDGIAFYMHPGCAASVQRSIEAENQEKTQEDTGSYAAGTLGALVGAAIGAVVWALVLNLGYVASLVGLLIGWLADKGYNLLRGKQGKAKVLILIIAIILGVLLGTILADVITLVGMINNGELYLDYGDILPVIFELLANDSEYAGAVASNICMGLLFAGLGVFALLKKAGKSVAGTKFTYLP